MRIGGDVPPPALLGSRVFDPDADGLEPCDAGIARIREVSRLLGGRHRGLCQPPLGQGLLREPIVERLLVRRESGKNPYRLLPRRSDESAGTSPQTSATAVVNLEQS